MKNKKIMFSICIPLYNTEKYIKECLDSVINQTYKDFEVIVIDDGSTDKSASIVEEYMIKNNRIKLVKQENKGLFYTRIRAIEEALGKFIICLDSDDNLEEEALEILDRKIKETNSDIIIFNNNIINENNQKRTTQTLYSGTKEWEDYKEEILRDFIFTKKINSIWRKVIAKELFQIEKLKNMPKISMGEDWIHSYYPLINAKKIFFTPDYLINYRVFAFSMTSKYDYSLWKTLGVIHKLNRELIEKGITKTLTYEEIDFHYLKSLSKTLLYIPGKIKDKEKYFQMLYEIAKNKSIKQKYKSIKINLFYRIPFILLYLRMYYFMYILKNIVSVVRNRK